MALSDIGYPWLKAAFDDATERLGRERFAQGRAIERERTRVAWTGRFQKRAAFFHISGDVLVVVARQHAPLAIPVEDDQVELVEFHLEQLPDRKRDQGELADGRAVLLLRRSQDGEMNEIDGGIGLEQVAPGPLARMRFA